MSRPPLFARHATALLSIAKDLGISTDESLAAHIRARGESCDRSRIAHWRAGRYTAPLGLLPLLLSHLGRDGARVILQALAEPHGLRVELDEVDAGSVEREVSDTRRRMGALTARLAEAQDPDSEGGHTVTPEEAAALLPEVRAAIAEHQQLEQALLRLARPVRAVR